MATVSYSFTTIRAAAQGGSSTTANDSAVTALQNGGWFNSYSHNLAHLDGTVYNAAGVATSQPTNLDLLLAGNQYDSALATLNNGNVVMVFTDESAGAGNFNIRAVLISPAGVTLSLSTIDVNGGVNTGDQFNADVSALADGGFAVVWTDTDGATDRDIVMATFNADGTARMGATNVRASVNDETDGQIAALTGGGFVVVWTELNGTDSEIWFQRYTSAGVADGAAALVDTAGSINDQPDVIGTADGGFMIAYRDNGWDAVQTDITLAKYSAAGAFEGYDRATFETTPQGAPSLARLSNGFIVLAWENENATETARTVDRAVFDSNGNVILSPGGFFISSADAAAVAAGANGQFAISMIHQDTTDSQWLTIQQIERNTTGDGTNEVLNGDDLVDTIYGLAGIDTLNGLGGADRLFGGDGIDTLNGGDGNDTLVGNDQIFVQQGDTLNGGNGDDLIYAETVDTINGGVGYDSLIAINAFNFTLDMAATSIEYAILDFGNDSVNAFGQNQAVTVFASGGNDQVLASQFADTLWGGSGNDTLAGAQGSDVLVGEAGADSLYGETGDDRIYFDAQDTVVSGASGYDAGYITVGTGAGVVINMGASELEFIQDFAGAGDTILASTMLSGLTAYAGGGNDIVDGSAYADVIWGEAGNDTLSGNDGADVIVGGAGGDILRGGLGNDALYGGAGDGVRDDFVFTAAGATHADAVYDFVIGTDKIDLSSFAGNTFASVSITSAGGSSIVRLNGQVICTVVGTVGLGIGDFIMSGAAPSDPGDTPIVKGDAASVLPALSDDSDMAQAAASDFALVSDPVFLGRPGWYGLDHGGGWMTVLV